MRGILWMQEYLMRPKFIFELTFSLQTAKQDKNTFQQIQWNITNVSV